MLSHPVRFAVPVEYEIGFDITPGEINAAWTSIVHFAATDDNNYAEYGNRMPAVFFYPGTHRLHIIDGQVSQTNDECPITTELPQVCSRSQRSNRRPTPRRLCY